MAIANLEVVNFVIMSKDIIMESIFVKCFL